jgi:Peptidase M15
VRAILAAAIVAALAVPAPAAAQDRGVHATSPGTAIVPPVPQPARRPSPTVGDLDRLPGPIVPPVPQPAVRPLRLAALAETPVPSPPAPQPITRQQWLAALSVRAPAGLPGPEPRTRSRRDVETQRLIDCLKPAARALLERIEAEFGEMRIISTCRRGARIAGTGRISRHATGEAIDFDAGPRKRDVVRWLIANHTSGGTMTYADMSHIHVDVGPHFVAINAWSGR